MKKAAITCSRSVHSHFHEGVSDSEHHRTAGVRRRSTVLLSSPSPVDERIFVRGPRKCTRNEINARLTGENPCENRCDRLVGWSSCNGAWKKLKSNFIAKQSFAFSFFHLFLPPPPLNALPTLPIRRKIRSMLCSFL